MITTLHRQFLGIALLLAGGVSLAACGSATGKRADVMDIYELPRAGHSTAVDNDSYYVQPKGYQGCAQINDAPGCGGG